MNPERKKILEALLKIKKEGPEYTRSGLCFNVLMQGARGFDILRKEIKKWPYYSGDPGHPIHTSKTLSASEQFGTILDKWNRNTDYGRRRWQLVNYLIRELKKEEKK